MFLYTIPHLKSRSLQLGLARKCLFYIIFYELRAVGHRGGDIFIPQQ